jgi:ABC-type branched-subunit amino acid transport system ATPase component
MVEWVSELAAAGMAVVWVVEQSLEKILAASNRAYLIEGGRSTAELESQELLEPGRLQELVLEGREGEGSQSANPEKAIDVKSATQRKEMT